MINRTVSFPNSWIALINEARKATGKNFNQLVLHAVAQYLNIKDNDMSVECFLDSLREKVRGRYSKESYPPQVTDLVFQMIEGDKSLLDAYNDACQKTGKKRLNQALGRMVRFALQAQPIGRANATRKGALAGSYTLLKPPGQVAML